MTDLSSPSPSAHIDLDDTDQAIIDLLRQDGRMPYRAIARALDIAENTVRARVRRMEVCCWLLVCRLKAARQKLSPVSCRLSLKFFQ